jgi:hypothetical protein
MQQQLLEAAFRKSRTKTLEGLKPLSPSFYKSFKQKYF